MMELKSIVFIGYRPAAFVSIFGILIDYIMDALENQSVVFLEGRKIDLRFIVPQQSPPSLYPSFETAMNLALQRYDEAHKDWKDPENYILFNPSDSQEITLGDDIYASPEETEKDVHRITNLLPENAAVIMDLILRPYSDRFYLNDTARLGKTPPQYILSHMLYYSIQGRNKQSLRLVTPDYGGDTSTIAQWMRYIGQWREVYERHEKEEGHHYETEDPKIYWGSDIDGGLYARECFYKEILETLFS